MDRTSLKALGFKPSKDGGMIRRKKDKPHPLAVRLVKLQADLEAAGLQATAIFVATAVKEIGYEIDRKNRRD